jgi:hypothetical protein
MTIDVDIETTDGLPIESFTFNYGKIDFEYNAFDGKFLTDRDLIRDQYAIDADVPATYELYRGGARVAVLSGSDGAPFVVDAAPTSSRTSNDTSGVKFVWLYTTTNTASLDDGKSVVFDTIVVRPAIEATHEYGHVMDMNQTFEGVFQATWSYAGVE